MREAGPTQGAERQADKVARWTARPRLSQFVRFTIIATPVILSVLFTIFMGRAFPPEELGMGRWTWVAAVFIMANLLLFVLGRLARRLTPLVGLMKLTLVFPDHAPSRSKALLRQSNSRSMLRAIDAAKLRGDDSEKTLHSDYLVQLLSDINKHDRLTRGHSERVRAYAELLGEELGLNDADMDKLRWSALLHDVGKLSVRPEILNKDGRPTDEEWAELQGHPAAAMEYLEPLKPWLGEWVHSADQHHCRWDGDGYPSDLAGTDISLAGRIVAIADAYDVMTSARSYKKPLSAELARQELTDCAGRQFDPTLVRAFLHVGLGELKAVAGPWAWLANLTGSAQLPVPITSAVTGAAWTAAVATVGFVAAGSAVPTETEGPFAFVPPPVVDVVESTTTTEPPVTTTVVPSSAGPTTVAPTTTIATTTSTSTTAAPTTTTVAPASVTTLPPNRPPSIAAAERTIDEDTPLGGIVLSATITDPEGQAVSASIVGGDPEGSFALSSSGVITVAKLLDFEAISEYPLVISATDGQASTNKVVVITIADVDEKPTATGSLLATWEDSSDRVDLTTKVSDPEGGTLTWNIPATTENGGTLTERDGVVSYTPALNFTGSDRFSYTVSDAAGNTSTPASVSLVVYATNDAPVGYNDSFTTAEDTSFVTGDATANDVDVDDGLDVTTTAIQMMPLNGIAVSNGDGTFTYAPDANFNGVDSFTYTVRDTEGLSTSPATVTITVNSVNDTPLAANDAVTTAEDAAIITGDVTANDTDIDDGLDITTITIDSPATNGTAASNGDGTFTYTPNADYNGVDTFTYTIADNTGTPSAPATVTITVTAENDPPVANDDGTAAEAAFTTTEDTAFITGDVTANDTDVDSTLDPTTAAVATDPADGTAVSNGDGTFTYTPRAEFSGTDTFTYTVSDTDGQASTPATVTITVTLVNDPPIASDNSFTTIEDTPFTTGDATANDTDIDSTLDPTTAAVESQASNGTAVSNGDGTFTYTPNANFNGVDTFTYTVSDTDGAASAAATITINVTAENDAPVANDDGTAGGADFTTPEDTAFTTGDVAANDTDIDDGLDVTTIAIDTNPSHGNVSSNNDGTFEYTPDLNYNGTDTFTYTIADNTGTPSAPATVTITIISENDLPTAADDTLTIDHNTSGNIDPRTNDSDPDGLPLTVVAVSTPSNGTAVIEANGTVTYTHNGSKVFTDSFTYDIEDADGAPATATIDITITPPPDADAIAAAFDNCPYHFNPMQFDTDGDGAGDVCDPFPTVTSTGAFTGTGQLIGEGNDRTFSLDVGDVDLDGDLDLVFGVRSDGTTVWLNDGTGTFINTGQSLGSGDVDAVVLADLDGDGDPGMIIANKTGGNTIWGNDGTGTYINTGQSLGNADTAAIAVGDVDLDGDLDVIFGNIGAANTLWLNDGNGFFTDSGQNLGNNDGLGVAVGDFDNDGDLDLAFAHLNEDNTILLNNGSGVFTNSGQALGSSESHDVAAADLDGDGDLDLVFAEDKDFDTVWLNDGFGVFTDTQQSLGLGHSHAVSLGDVDGDGDIDIFFGDHISFNTVFINDGSASFTTFFQAPGEEKTEDIILGDLNGDGRLDGATANDNEEASIWLNN